MLLSEDVLLAERKKNSKIEKIKENNMPKEDCKYWDKCYQKNEYHLQKYNHPRKDDTQKMHDNKDEDTKTPTDASSAEDQDLQKKAPKRTTPSNAAESEARDAKAEHEPHSIAEEGNDGASANDEQDKYDTAALREEALSNIAGKNYMEILRKRIKLSVQAEYDDLLRSNEFIRHKFLVEMPPDFYAFWKFAESLKKDLAGEDIVKHFEKTFQFLLVGPFDFLAGRFHKAKIREPGDYTRHWRFFYDVPEFQTIFVKKDTGIHYGYWRDTPQEKDGLLLARNDVAKGCEFEFIAGNAFDAFLYYLEKDYKPTPFTASAVANIKKSLQHFLEANEVNVEKLETLKRARNLNVVAKTFHRAGIVVPYERKSQLGYRSLSASDAELKKILKLFEHKTGDKDEALLAAVIEKLTPIATAANIAVDECDFGTALELGIDLFCSGYKELHLLVQSLLVPAYSLLQRPQFIAISKAHMEQRSKEIRLSIFDLDKSE